MINASADLLEYIKLDDHAEIVRNAIWKAINVEKLHTLDMGGSTGTAEIMDFIVDEVESQTQLKAYTAAQ